MLEPISSLTNLAFILFGLFIYKRSPYVGIVTVILGVASAGWHWTHSPFWHTFDLGMMYFMLLGLVNYATGSNHTKVAFLAGTVMVGLHFVLPSNLIIISIASVLLIALIRHYPPHRIFIIVGCFVLWISTNIPYLHQWDVPFWKLDISHGFSHICAGVGIYKVVSYKPTTFFDLTKAFKTIHFPTLSETARREFERLIDVELNPVLGNRRMEDISQDDIDRLIIKTTDNRDSMQELLSAKLHQIFEFATGRGIRHNLVAV